MLELVESFLKTFAQVEKNYPAQIPHAVTFPALTPGAGSIVFGSIIHGNEVGSLPGILRILKILTTKRGLFPFRGEISFFLGNPKAALAGKRYLEQDLNRVFCPQAAESLESRRALELQKLLNNCTLFVDFHQTSEKCVNPFYIFGFQEASYHWARAALGSKVLVTRDPRQSFESGSMCGDEWVRARGIPAITLELGQKGFNTDAEMLTESVVARVLEVADRVTAHATSLSSIAQQTPDLDFYHVVSKLPFGGLSSYLHSGLINFAEVAVNQKLGKRADGTDIVAPLAGVTLFPKYPDRDEKGEALPPLSQDIVQILRKLAEHPLSLWV